MKYKFIDDITSDVMYEAYGKNLKELFENSALALFSIICQIEKVKPKETVDVDVKAEKVEDLMINWLQELIALVDIEEKFFSKLEILQIGEKHIKAKIHGETMTPEKGGTVVKSVTFYKYSFEKTKEGYKVKISLDI